MTPLARKLLVKPGSRIGPLNAPEGYEDRLRPLPEGAELTDLQPGLDVRRERFGLSYFILSDAALDAAAPLLTLAAR